MQVIMLACNLKEPMKATPYTTKSGIRIGCMYTPPLRQLSRGEYQLQSVLLEPRKPLPLVLRLILRWL